MRVDKRLRDFRQSEQRRQSAVSRTGGTRSTSWFGRHLNLTMGLGLVVYFVLGANMLAGPYLVWFGAMQYFPLVLNSVAATLMFVWLPTGEVGDQFANVSNIIFVGLPVVATMWWALGQKGRNRTWLLCLIVPCGWIVPLLLKDSGSSRKVAL